MWLIAYEEKTVSTESTRAAIKAKKGQGVHLPPNPRRLVKILAAVGHTLPSAVADIVDNSISAGATEICGSGYA